MKKLNLIYKNKKYMKLLEYADFAQYRPITICKKGQLPIYIDSEKSKEKDLLIRSIIDEFYTNLIGNKEINGFIVSDYLLDKAQKNIGILHEITNIAISENKRLLNADQLLDYIRENKYDLFHVNGKYFNLIYNRLKSTSDSGKDVEIKAKDFFTKYTELKGISIELKDPTKEEDKKGTDLYFNYKGKSWTIQTKTLSSIKEESDHYIAYISGDFTKINTNYLVLISNNSNNKNYIFNGKNIDTKIDKDGKIFYSIPNKNFLYSK